MVAKKNRVAMALFCLLAAAAFITACSPPGPAALMNGKKLLDAGKTDDAIVELKTAVTLMQTNAAAWNYLGVAYHRAGFWMDAIYAYSQALRFNRELLEARFNLGCVFLEQNKLEPAKTEFTAFTLRRPNVIEGFNKLGTAQMRTRDLAGAEKSFREALKIKETNVEALNALGMVAAQLNRPRDAAESFAKALKQQPNFRPALLNLATVLHHQLKDRTEALERYREYLALQPHEPDWDVVSAIAKSLEPTSVALGQPRIRPAAHQIASNTNVARPITTATPKPTPQTTAAKSITTTPPRAPDVVKPPPDSIIKTTPDDSLAVQTSSPAMNTPAKPAITSGTSATLATKETKQVQRGLLNKLNPFKRDAKTNAPAASVALVTNNAPPQPTLKTIDRKSAEQSLASGQHLQSAGKLAEALQSYKRATSLDENYFEGQYHLGLAAFEARSFKAASRAWEKAIAIRPDSADARYNLARTLKAEGRFQDTADELEKLLSLHPDEARGHLTLGNLYAEQLRDATRARKHYGSVLKLDPLNPQAKAIRYWLAVNPG
jgi:tetratricopeptide (TPR) repeat protein